MEFLRYNYNKLCATEMGIKLEIVRAEDQFLKASDEALKWLERVETVKKQVDDLERLLAKRSTWRLSSKRVLQVTEAVHGLLEPHFKHGLLVSDGSALWPEPILVGTSALMTLNKIWANLMNPQVGRIGIYGLGGVGKTTIMMNIENRLKSTAIFDKVLWVTVSKELNIREVQNDIAFQLGMGLASAGEDREIKAARLREKLKEEEKFVIVLDDLWEDFSLEKVGIPEPSKDNGCKIVLISRSVEICRYMRADKIVRVEVLSPNEAWDLFVSKAGKIVLTPDIQPFAKKLVQKCCHVPIVIVSVGLSMKDEVSVKTWRKSLVELSTPVADRDDIVLDLLRYSYNRLRNEKLQNCFLYCAFFPEDYLFKPEELIRYWMAEGFIHVNGDTMMEIEDGFNILIALLDANMLEMITKGGDDWLKMHDSFRELAIKVMKEKPRCWFRGGLGPLRIPLNSEWNMGRKISFIRSKLESLDVLATDCNSISTLLLNDNPISHFQHSFFNQLLFLKFLDLSYSLVEELPTSVSELAQLRVLFLHYCVNLKTLPSVEKMRALEVLNLCGTSIAKLPQGMEGLVRLRSLDMSETASLENIEVGVISSLTHLEELRMQGSGLCKMDSPIVANYLMEMRCLKRLQILTISVVGYEHVLETVLHLQGYALKKFSVNLYGSTDDYNEDEDTH